MVMSVPIYLPVQLPTSRAGLEYMIRPSFGSNDLNLELKPFKDLFEQETHVFFGLVGRRHNYSVANVMLCLTSCQHFHNKPLFSGGKNIAGGRE